MADPDLQIRGGGHHPDPEIRGGGGGLQKNLFWASFWLKNKGGSTTVVACKHQLG